MMIAKNRTSGFTLIETLLVMVIISMVIYAGIGYVQQRTLQMKIDRTSTQMQQILNAGLSYYVANNEWPANLSDLQGTYLPPASVGLKNPWGQDYGIASTPGMFYVYTQTISQASAGASAAARVIAGTLPLSYTTTATSGTPPAAGTQCTTQTTCSIVASVNIPGQNLNNARAINFAGLYKHGACVPVPKCPVDANGTTMTPQVFVAPVQVAGTFDGGNSSSNPAVYPISSFSAYAVGPSATPGGCASGGAADPCTGGGPGSPTYWRVCMQVVTERGLITSSATGWGDNQRLMALTRCVSDNEPAGSDFTVFTN